MLRLPRKNKDTVEQLGLDPHREGGIFLKLSFPERVSQENRSEGGRVWEPIDMQMGLRWLGECEPSQFGSCDSSWQGSGEVEETNHVGGFVTLQSFIPPVALF